MKIKAWLDAHPVVKNGLKGFWETVSYVCMAVVGAFFGLFIFFAFLADQFPGVLEWFELF